SHAHGVHYHWIIGDDFQLDAIGSEVALEARVIPALIDDLDPVRFRQVRRLGLIDVELLSRQRCGHDTQVGKRQDGDLMRFHARFSFTVLMGPSIRLHNSGKSSSGGVKKRWGRVDWCKCSRYPSGFTFTSLAFCLSTREQDFRGGWIRREMQMGIAG